MDGSGATLQTQSFDEYGNLQSRTSSIFDELQFAGQQGDPNGRQYLRARYYDPSTGRFLSRDPLPASVRNPARRHPYLYASNNPASLSDPTGLCNSNVPTGQTCEDPEGPGGSVIQTCTVPGLNGCDIQTPSGAVVHCATWCQVTSAASGEVGSVACGYPGSCYFVGHQLHNPNDQPAQQLLDCKGDIYCVWSVLLSSAGYQYVNRVVAQAFQKACSYPGLACNLPVDSAFPGCLNAKCVRDAIGRGAQPATFSVSGCTVTIGFGAAGIAGGVYGMARAGDAETLRAAAVDAAVGAGGVVISILSIAIFAPAACTT